jgi:diguanylate cyclase (GGDEF)-like protein
LKKVRIAIIVNFFGSDFYLELANGIETFCNSHDCVASIFSVGDIGVSYSKYGYQKRASAALINKDSFDGVIMLSSFQATTLPHEELYAYMQSFAPLPMVSIGVPFPDIHSILVDNKQGMREMVTHIIEKHHCKKIALLGVKGDSEDAKIRTEVFRQVLKEKNIPFSDDDIIYGQFTYTMTKNALKEYMTTHTSFDYDAVVALNDDMAFAVNDFCQSIGIPRDKVVITGFDDLVRSSFSSPTISSVNQQIQEQGELAMSTICALIEGRQVPLIQYVPSRALFRQSCGCISYDDYQTNSISYDGTRSMNKTNKTSCYAAEWYEKKAQLLHIERYHETVDGSYSLEELRMRMNDDIRRFNFKSAAICLYDQPICMEDFRYFSLPEKAYIFSAFDEGKEWSPDSENETVYFNPRKCILPEGIISDSKTSAIVISLYHCERQFGYFVFRPGDYDLIIYEFFTTMLFTELDNAYFISQDLEARKKLSSVSQTDELTGAFNRRGFLSLGLKAVELAVSTNRTGCIIYCDMDGLKKINDTFGHDAGDCAIKGESSILHSVFRENDIIGRIGGDEFAIVAPGLKIRKLSELKQRIDSTCAEWNKRMKLPFNLSLSIGCAEFSSEKNDFDTVMKEADKRLYEEKRKRHAKKGA